MANTLDTDFCVAAMTSLLRRCPRATLPTFVGVGKLEGLRLASQLLEQTGGSHTWIEQTWKCEDCLAAYNDPENHIERLVDPPCYYIWTQ